MSSLNQSPSLRESQSKWLSIFITLIISGLLTYWGIYGIGEYGIALFFLTPIFIGACPIVLFGYKKRITETQSWKTGLLTLGLFSLGIFLVGMEGVICIIMAAPIAIPLTLAGSYLGYSIVRRSQKNSLVALILLLFAIPLTAFIEKDQSIVEHPVTTSVIIDADPETVWNNVIEFPELNPANELIFRAGIAYPTDATIDGKGIGAIRYCNFSTGSFIEPITTWEEPTKLAFDVIKQPEPMNEVSMWNVKVPHLDNYFVSKRGQFELEELDDGRTKLTGTTWYVNKIKPHFYWSLWSDYIVHKIHHRVLIHIKDISEDP
ncbi:hypothetical protein [Gracilimonas sp.]|uniref:hypothetical protein n=1 Tax=Gracilimonas sp. TaxID=1974203 RepID=UPI003BAA060E